ncbi:dolichyl-P-Glc:Man9GlcNAc2-PP-dolichol alpha-1,3-glucosyltransferase [Malassezia psittaci]|uniref:Alpha-1,3-glucosyltransferase n=1 Tax=Malassezia psittaci TaxID=1821823 RepID=A0AAF0F6E8_9BASI|nr:dolichyl-P-Glc:Man9GlcNAc2-PP-dolichol alpha-1,3-glucosyltransferase [Malassezia psittaci]
MVSRDEVRDLRADLDADFDRSADIPLGSARIHTRRPREKPSTSSLGSSSRAPSQPSYRPGSSRRLAHIPDDAELVDSRPSDKSIEQWISSNIPPSVRIPREKTSRHGRASSSTSHRHRVDDTSSVRERISRNDQADVLSAKALSSSSRLLRPGRLDSSAFLADDQSAQRSYERIANWRDQNVEHNVRPSMAASQRRSSISLHADLKASAHQLPLSRPQTHRPPSVMQSGRGGEESSAIVRSGIRRAPTTVSAQSTDSPLRDVLRWLNLEEHLQSIHLIGLGCLLLIRCLIAIGGYSGQASPPMYGDFEAQRHWMELTWHLPPNQWYFYDLPYWGLDYPPLTAWVSYGWAWIAMRFPILHSSFALKSSRGAESVPLLVFMRCSVCIMEGLIYIPAVKFFLNRKLQGRSSRAKQVVLYTVLLQPALLLIDYGHFQYNSVMLGLSTVCFTLLYTKLPNVHVRAHLPLDVDLSSSAGLQRMLLDSLSRQISYEYVLAAVFFSLSLCFKQMALYYAPAVFVVMLGRCIGLAKSPHPSRGVWLFLGLAAAALATFLLAFLPWAYDTQNLWQCVIRIFPLARGLFEDKVANVWCFLSVLPIGRYKLHRALPAATLAKISLVATLLSLLPGCLLLMRASIETVRLESILDDAQAAQVVDKVRKRGGTSIASGRETASVRPASRLESIAAHSKAPSANESSHGSDRMSNTSQSLFAGSTSTWVASGRPRPRISLPGREVQPRALSASMSPVAALLPYTLLSTSLAFFLLGFQTHEKSILLPLLPLTLLLTTKGDTTGAGAAQDDWEWAILANNVGVFG